jgi:hypothetical protein
MVDGAQNALNWAIEQGDYMALNRLLTCIMANAGILCG